MALLELRGVDAGYGRAQVLFGASLELGAGEVVMLAGRNGAGKSTTLKAVMGLIPVRSGEIIFGKENISHKETHEIARLGLGYVPEERRIFTGLTVRENLEVGRRAGAWDETRIFALFENLKRMETRPAAHMSGGEQKMLAIARTLMGNPRAVLLDEPSEGLAPRLVQEMAEAIGDLKKNGLAVLLCEQNRRFAERIVDRAYLIERGEVRPA